MVNKQPIKNSQNQFYETYKDNPKLSPLVTALTWTNNLLINKYLASLLKRDNVLNHGFKKINRHSREGGNPVRLRALQKMDSRLRGSDVCFILYRLKWEAKYRTPTRNTLHAVESIDYEY